MIADFYDRLYPETAGSGNRPLECLSLVRGNSHAGFLEEPGAGNGPWPTRPASGLPPTTTQCS
jgi:hypothetical protein